MMLQALIAYAEREKLGDPDLEVVGVRWLIPLDDRGDLAGDPIPLAENPGDKKPRPKPMNRPFTSPNELNQGTKSHFLCDTLERAVLFLDPKFPERVGARTIQHGYFQALLLEASDEVEADAAKLRAVVRFLRTPSTVERLHERLRAAKAKPSDNATFSVAGVILLDLGKLQVFWRNRRARVAADAGERSARVCVATGKLGPVLDTTEKVKGVPGGLATGTNLISFDKDSFCSFGLDQAQNAALSPSAELKIRSALNHLIAKSRSEGLVFNGTVMLHWTREKLAEPDPYDLLAQPDERAVAALMQSVQTGRELAAFDTNAYYAAGLSGNGARIVVRYWLESTVADVRRSIADWFSDLSIVEPDGSGTKRDLKFSALLYGLVRAKIDEVPPQLPAQLLHAALMGRSLSLPQPVLAAALRRQQLDQDNKINPARLALIKACLLRTPNSNHQPTEIMTECLNPSSRDTAYLCGRLFAVFDRLQYLALEGVNAGVVERYYASASVTPALVMGRLFRNAQFHLAKAGGGVAENVRKDFEEIACALGDTFPATLDLEGQGRFALGYYHQKAEFRRRTAERKDKQAAGSMA